MAQLGTGAVGADWKVDLYGFVEKDDWTNIADDELPTTPYVFLPSLGSRLCLSTLLGMHRRGPAGALIVIVSAPVRIPSMHHHETLFQLES